MPSSRPSVIVVAHGSRISDTAQEAAVRHAATLVHSNLYELVDVCFLSRDKSRPLLPEGKVFLLPFFMSNGYFVRNRIPELFELEKGRRIESRHQLYLCDPLGTDPELADVIITMAQEICRDHNYTPKKVQLLLVAHGSETSSASAEATCLQQQAVTGRDEFAGVYVAFLSQAPRLDEVLSACLDDGSALIVVGLFAADGPHAIEDVPGSIAKWQQQSMSTMAVHYAGAVGSRPEIANLIQRSIARCAAKVG
ncbi:CbiX/SirB N-terminal domain-containing protein [uncultured Sneathiella sp.]|uniref:CbiX/SirB N-terminal domain-containing protein n=1 Tax=uncultured Sneathiella sp. TaxID=879315 RepID=UPI0030EBBB7C|tara:strand:- start:6608 stop:7363 length:756 start_codon:yes stop_codon:yes gene_type:complete